MALERPPGAIGVAFRVKTQHYSCDVAPVGILRIRVEQAQICDDVFLVVNGQRGIRWRGIGDIGIKRRLLHTFSRNTLLMTNFAFGFWHIDDREAVTPHSLGVGLADRGRRLLGNIPPSPVLHGKLAPSGSASYCLLFPGMVGVAISAA